MTPETGATWRDLQRRGIKAIGRAVETRWLLEQASGLDAACLLREMDRVAPREAAARFEDFVQRRLAGEPLQHVLGRWAFRDLEVTVDSRVLIPRPETEQVVSLALDELDRLAIAKKRSVRTSERLDQEMLAVDLGTGSGVIGLSLVSEREAVRVIATDRERDALDVTACNLLKLDAKVAARVELRLGDFYEALPIEVAGQVDLIVSNPPYLAEHEWSELASSVRDFDPVSALVAGPSGLEAIEAILIGSPEWLDPHGAVVVEIAPRQALAVTDIAKAAGFETAYVRDDLARRPRVLVARR